MTPFRQGPHCPDHPAHDARYCADCWHEINAGTRPDTMIGRHLEPQAVSLEAAFSLEDA